MSVKLVLDARVCLAETPIWDNRIKKLYWTDLFEGTVHIFDAVTSENVSVETNCMIGSAIPCQTTGKVLVAIDSGLHILDVASGELDLVADPNQNNPQNRYNDTRCDAKGRLFTSTVSKLYGTAEYTPDMLGAFYMVDTDNSVSTVVDGINQYNGIVFDQKNENMFVIDTYNQTLLRFSYDLEKGAIGAPEVVINFEAMPDGMSIDIEDNLYICHWNGTITIWETKGFSKIKTIQMPVSYVCCGGFGGDDRKDFYVATSKFAQPDDHPDVKAGAGGIFHLRNEIEGRSDWYYHG